MILGAAHQFASRDGWLLVAIFFLLVLLAFCSVAEMGLSRMTKPKAAALVDRGGRTRAARVLVKLVSEPERWINPLLLTVFICQIVQSTMTAIVFDDMFGAWGVVVGVAINVFVFFVFAEAVPKTYAVIYPDRAALLVARPTSALVAFPPLRWVSKGLIWLTNVLVPGKGLHKGPYVSEQELLGIVQAAAHDGVVEHEEHMLIESVIEFGDTVAREIMVPRPDMVVAEYHATVTEALDLAIEKGVSRLPVLGGEGNEDDVVGLAYTKDLMRLERDGKGASPVHESVRPVHVVPENKPVSRLMREMQAQKYHLAFVADEYGAIAGLITLEDCLEELVGEIVDEHDTEQEEVERLSNGDYLVDGGMSVGDVNDLLEISIPDDDWDTIGGFLFGTLEHVPDVGESVDFDGWKFSAHEVEGRRVRRLRVCLLPQTAPDPDHEEDDD
ncbi:MAG TPA: hemolysin family protein [Ilumatobacteraceae bacterium]